MAAQNGIEPAQADHGTTQQSVEVIAAFLLCLEEQERAGLNRRCAVLAAVPVLVPPSAAAGARCRG